MEAFFDCWSDLPGFCNPSALFENYFSNQSEPQKVKLDYSIDIFKDCLKKYGIILGNNNRAFPLSRLIMLYAVIQYLIHHQSIPGDSVSDRLRIINNLIMNSEYEISDSENRVGGNRMPAILAQTRRIMLYGLIESEETQDSENGFNVNQLREEAEKMEWLLKHPEWKAALHQLEDHDLLYGCIGIVGLETPELFQRFEELFDCSRDKISCVMLTLGDYAIQENNWRYQMGARKNDLSWRTLFHALGNPDFSKARIIMSRLLQLVEKPSNGVLDELIDAYLQQCEESSLYDWRYYFIKYEVFRPDSYGKYTWNDKVGKPYQVAVMHTRTKWSQYTYQPFLMAVDPGSISKEDYGQRLVKGNYEAVCINDAYLISPLSEESEPLLIEILQNDAGIDTEDRILKFRRIWEDLFSSQAN